MMSSCWTLRLNRRRAFSSGSPSCNLTSAKFETPPNYPDTEIKLLQSFRGKSSAIFKLDTILEQDDEVISSFNVPGREPTNRGEKDIHVTIRSYQGIKPKIDTSCYVDESAQVIGDVVLEKNASVWMNAVVRGDVYAIRIG